MDTRSQTVVCEVCFSDINCNKMEPSLYGRLEKDCVRAVFGVGNSIDRDRTAYM